MLRLYKMMLDVTLNLEINFLKINVFIHLFIYFYQNYSNVVFPKGTTISDDSASDM